MMVYVSIVANLDDNGKKPHAYQTKQNSLVDER